MEPANAKEVEKNDCGEEVCKGISPKLTLGDNNIKDLTISEELQSGLIKFDNKDESQTGNKLQTETETQLDTRFSEDVKAVSETDLNDVSEVNREVNHNQKTDITWYSEKIPEDKAVYDDVKVQALHSLGIKNKAGNCQEQKYTSDSDCVNIPGETFVSTDVSALESESGEEKGFKAEAAVIKQENFENTLKCQSHDDKSEEINNTFQDEGAEASEHNAGSEDEKKKGNNDSPRERSMEEDCVDYQSDENEKQPYNAGGHDEHEKETIELSEGRPKEEDCVDSQRDPNEKQPYNAGSHDEHEKQAIDLSEGKSIKGKDCIVSHCQNTKENDPGNDKGIEKIAFVNLSGVKEVVTVSDDNSFEVSTTNETHSKLDSTHSCHDTSIARVEFHEKAILNQTGDVVSLDDDESRAGDIIENLKILESIENEKTEAIDGSAVGFNYASYNNSKEMDNKTTNESVKDDQGDNNIKFEKSTTDGLNEEITNFNEKLETIHSSKESFINDNDKQNTSGGEETKILKNEIRIKLRLNGDFKNIPSPASQAHENDHLEHPVENDTISTMGVPIKKDVTVLQQKQEDETFEVSNHGSLKAMERCDSESKAYFTEDAEVCDMEIDNESKLDTTMSSQLNSTGTDINNMEHEDESSHCSSLASVESNSTGTSSSHQLVIDHPMEELDAASSLPSHETGLSTISLPLTQLAADNPMEELGTDVSLPSQNTVLVSNSHMEAQKKSDNLKGLKRKLSESSAHGFSPNHKLPHLEIEPYDYVHIANLGKMQQASENSTTNDSTNVEHTPFKSLLLQRLQKPYMPPPPPPPSEIAMSPTTTSSMFPQPLEQTSFIISQPILPASISNASENITTATKYLCFKCKTGCFESFTSLNEHQRECLADTRLLPKRIAEIASILPISLPPALTTPPSSASPDVTADITITDVALQSTISTIVPSNITTTTATLQKKRYYKCSSCNTFHENWNLFLHIRDKHQRHMCIYCIRFFPTAEKLSVHLEIKHDLEQIHFHSEEALRKSVPIIDGVLSEKRFLMCCTCQHLFEESEPFSDHNCAEFMKPCSLCGQNGRHSNQCKAHPDAKRSSRTKKKSKKVVGETVKSMQPRSHDSLPLNSLSETNLNTNVFNCDSNQPTAIVPTDYPRAPVATLHNEDSNSSSNMVIDESCTTTHSSLVNPFKELDERWRLEQQSQNPNETNLYQTRDPSPNESKLTVPKFKLRVPKEFQKSVDVALSSTDSDEEDEINEDEGINVGTHGESSTYKNDNTVAGTTPGLPYLQNNLIAIATEPSYSQKRIDDNSQETRSVDKDEFIDDTNPDLARILQEIERTKLDIQRTKETLHHTPLKKFKHGPAAEATTRSNQGDRNWTPTPPTSPKQAGCLSLQSDSKQLFTDTESVQPETQPSPPLQRKDSQGSDEMDIDETITGQSSEQPPREKSECITTGSTAPELNTSEDNKNFNISNSSTNTKASSITDQNVTDIDHHSKQEPHDFANADDEKGEQIDATKQQVQLTDNKESLPHIPTDGIEVANEDVLIVDLQLDRPLEKIEVVDFIRICLKAVYPICLYCNHARRIAVNGQSLVLHMLAQHRFSATVDSITAEELKPETICAKLKTFLPILENDYFNSTSYCTTGEGIFTHHFNERIFECFQCRFVTSTHKELYLHNRKMHLKTAILCFMCRANFFSFSEILCHICPGAPNKTPVFDVKFRCCLCDLDDIPSPFRLMVHLRKRHFACDICLEDCRDQGRLSSHVWKHKLHHVCYRCGIAYRNKMDITKHLFWKHGTESIICKRCLQKRWRHVYHFCVPPITFNCDVCNLCFSKAMYLNVHKRLHNGDLRYPCTEENCDEKFISRKLLLKHTATHMQQETGVANALEELGKPDEDMKPFEADKEIEAECSKTSEQEMEQDAMDIKKESTETVPATKSPSVKCEKSESNVEEKTDNKPDMNVENIDHAKEGKAICKEEKCADSPRKKKKKNKRSKESLEDLNLIAPNLSETDSSEESDIDNKSRADENSLVPKVMLSPLSEAEYDLEKVKKIYIDEKEKSNTAIEGKETLESGTGNVLEIWKNLLQTQQGNATSETNEKATLETESNSGDDNYSIQDLLKVIYADHDYCKIVSPPSPVHPATVEKAITLSVSPIKRNKVAKSPRRVSNRRSASSSSSDSSSSSGSSCSCGSNCSCSSSGSHSSSSSSSSDDSDSSVASNTSRKRHRKKSDRERSRKKSESVSPLKKQSAGTVKVVDDDFVNDVTANSTTERVASPPKEPQIYESDLETAESETDEEFYDEHPQKLASELLAQKRAQLMAQTRLSPSHNFDIVENSRPSTPSLPEDVICETTRVKMKKKKRDRKSSGKTNAPAAIKTKGENKSFIDVPPIPLSGIDSLPPYDFNKSSPGVAESLMTQHQNIFMPYSSVTMTGVEQLTPRPIAPHMPGRVSEGSSCSDLDGSLKRSKRARRPNKFYGYTSDDDNSVINLGQPLMMGMRTIKPQPPPQLTWRKEDLPTPSKSIVNPKSKGTRTPKTANTTVSSLSGGLHHDSPASMSTKIRRITGNTEKSSARKRIPKKTTLTNKLPPIPTLKIRPSQLGIGNDSTGGGTTTEHFPTSQIYSSSKETDDDDDDENNSSEASSDGETSGVVLEQPNSGTLASTSSLWKNSLNQSTTSSSAVHTQQLLQLTVPQPVLPTPQASVFNHKIPPALLPNPNFETLQYFKANNIRYPIRPPAGARQAREGESVYCYCRCPYDEVSEMIACDGENCLIEWFHFECVGIMVAPQGKWFCAECRPKYSEELYPTSENV